MASPDWPIDPLTVWTEDRDMNELDTWLNTDTVQDWVDENALLRLIAIIIETASDVSGIDAERISVALIRAGYTPIPF